MLGDDGQTHALINRAEKDTTWLQSLQLLPISLYVQPGILKNFNKTKGVQCTLQKLKSRPEKA